MDMMNILKKFDAAASGKKPSAAKADADSMKAILESIDRITAVEECGMTPGAITTSAPQREGSPVSMNISLNASGKENVDELMALLKSAGIGQNTPVRAMPGGAAFDLDTDGEDDMEIELPSKDQEMDMATMRQIIAAGDKDVDEEWDNSPDEQYSDHETMTKDLSGGINRQKKMFKPAAKGDNPMAVESVKERLWAALNEKKTVKESIVEDGGEGPEDLLAAIDEEMKNPGKTIDNLQDVLNGTFDSMDSPEFERPRAMIAKYLELVTNTDIDHYDDEEDPNHEDEPMIRRMRHGNLARHIREYDLGDYLAAAYSELDKVVRKGESFNRRAFESKKKEPMKKAAKDAKKK